MGMWDWVWLAILVLPCFGFAAICVKHWDLAESNRVFEAPSRPKGKDPFDLLKPQYYTVTGNEYRRKAWLFYMPIPVAWVVSVFLVTYLIAWAFF